MLVVSLLIGTMVLGSLLCVLLDHLAKAQNLSSLLGDRLGDGCNLFGEIAHKPISCR